jgi:hypothetical protein
MNFRHCERSLLRAIFGAFLTLGLLMPAWANPMVSMVFAGDSTLDDDAGKLIAQGREPFADFATLLPRSRLPQPSWSCLKLPTPLTAKLKNLDFDAPWIWRI